LNKAAEQGSAKTQYELGTIFASDQYGMKNLQQAYFWFSLVNDKSAEAKKALSDVGIEIKPDEMLRALEMVNEFKEKNK